MRTAAPAPLYDGISPTPSSSLYFKVSEPLSHPSDVPLDFSPPLIAMVVVLAAAFLFVTYSRIISRRFISPMFRRFRRWRHRRRRLLQLSSSVTSPSSSDLRSLSPLPFDSFHYSYSPYGLDDSVIKTLPLFLYSSTACNGKTAAAWDRRDCAVCLLEFEDGDYVRTLPSCSHAFHVDCIDEWLRSHPNCPLCRAAILRLPASATVAPPSPFVPLMASRIRPSLDEEEDAIIICSISDAAAEADQEIAPSIEEQSPAVTSLPTRYFELKRSYSFGFERGSASERITTEPATVSPWRYGRSAGTFWSKRASPFGNLILKPRLFSFRYYRYAKSSFFRRQSGGFFPTSERLPPAGSSSRRIKTMTSPMLFRSVGYSSSRMRCGDPEALLSPERWSRRR